MDKEQVIALAREAGMPPIKIITDKPIVYPTPESLEHFANLVAAHEREMCWRTAENYDTGLEAAIAIRARGQA